MKNTKFKICREPLHMHDRPYIYAIYYRGTKTLYINTAAKDTNLIIIRK